MSVAVDEALYASGFNGPRSNWYPVRQLAGRITAAGRLKEVVFEPVDAPGQEAINDRIDDAYRAKYSGSPYLNAMIGNVPAKRLSRFMPR